jgi:hypothetical protein
MHRSQPLVLLSRQTALSLLLLTLLGCSTGGGAESQQGELERNFEESMRNVTLEGHFTVQGSNPDRLREERYVIEKVTKLAGDLWTIQARIQYGEHDVSIPVPVKVLWAGDTPVISLTDVSLPGLGTFSARVLFYRDQYAGTWSHGETRGNQFGRLVHSGQ